MSVAMVAAGAVVVGSVVSANAAEDAASTQANAATDASNKQIALNDPYRQMGLGAGNRLMTLLGLTPGPAFNAPDRNTLRAQLLPQFTTGGTPAANSGGNVDAMQAGSGTAGSGGMTGGTVDEAGLNAAIDKQMAGGSGMGDPTDPAFGSLMKDFTPADFAAGQDPGYQFRMDQGNQALQNSAAARGGLLSGRAMKDAMAYNGGQASQEYQNAFNRFQVNRSNKLNPLQSLMGVGQTATGTMGTDIGNGITGAANARAAGTVGAANAINSGIGQGTSQYQNNVLMNNLFPKAGTSVRPTGATGLDASMYAG